MAQLPEELIVEILIRLPVKSLLRFKCLSKLLRSVIETSRFINSHNLISCSSQKLNQRKLICSSRNVFEVCDVNIVDSEEKITLRLEKPVTVSWNSVYGYCKGLLLLGRQTSGLFGLTMWNPSTRKSRDLPDCPLGGAHLHLKRTVGLGLGYDDSINDYQVCCIVNVKPTPKSKLQVQVWIYRLKSNIWRRTTLDFPDPDYTMEAGRCCFRTPGIGYFAEGSLYWLIHDNNWKKKIVAFDMKQETFALVPQPDLSFNSKKDGVQISMKLHVLEGCLCIGYVMSGAKRRAYLYMMEKKDGSVGNFTWKNLFSVRKTKPILPRTYNIDSFGNMRVLGYSKSGGKILLHFGKDCMLWYDLKMKTFGEVETNMNNEWYNPILCVESLVSVQGGDEA